MIRAYNEGTLLEYLRFLSTIPELFEICGILMHRYGEVVLEPIQYKRKTITQIAEAIEAQIGGNFSSEDFDPRPKIEAATQRRRAEMKHAYENFSFILYLKNLSKIPQLMLISQKILYRYHQMVKSNLPFNGQVMTEMALAIEEELALGCFAGSTNFIANKAANYKAFANFAT